MESAPLRARETAASREKPWPAHSTKAFSKKKSAVLWGQPSLARFRRVAKWLPSRALKRRRQADHVLRLSRELDREILIGPDEAPKPEINQTPRINQVTRRPPTGARRFLCNSADRLIVIHRREFGLLRNRPDASLLLRARWIAQTRWCFGAANKRRNPMNRLIKNKDVLHLLEDCSSHPGTKGCRGVHI